MKTVPYIIMIFLTFLLYACGEDAARIQSSDGSIYGSWNWVSSQGGFTGSTLKPPPRQRRVYSTNGTVSFYVNDTLSASARIKIKFHNSYFGADSVTIIHYEDTMRYEPEAFGIRNDTLFIREICADCYNHVFTRIR